MTVYSSGDWYAKPGHEAEFVRLWRERSESAFAEIGSDAWTTLLRDKENPHHFISVGAFSDEIALVAWRDGDGLKNRLAELAKVLEGAETSVYEVVESLGESGLTP